MKYLSMQQEHTEQVAELEKLCFQTPWSLRSVISELSNPLALWIVAVDGDVVAGYIGSQTVMDESDMMNLAVHPDYRRRGIGLRLVEELIHSLKKQGVKALTLEVRVSNDQAIALYQKLGFTQVGRRPNYYSNPKEDALILRLEIS